MASILNTLICAGLAAALWTTIGLAVAIRVAPRALAMPMAAALGWAVHSAAALPIFLLVGMSRVTVAAVMAGAMLAAVVALGRARAGERAITDRITVPALAGAALLALAVAAAVLPKVSDEGVALAAPIFDHSKVAMIDEMARLGVPPANPFFGEAGAVPRLAYYYLWHFSAAELALLTGASGWEADAGLTWFTAYASLVLMMGLATWLSGRASSAGWVLVLAATASMRPVLSWLLGEEKTYAWIQWPTGFGGWLFQVAWAPQHVASASCVVLSALLLARSAERQGALNLLTVALVAAAAFESSVWIGGVTFPLSVLAIGLMTFAGAEPRIRPRFAACLVVAALLAIALASPLLYDQLNVNALRHDGTPIAVVPYSVLGDAVPEPVRRMLDLPAYWLIFLAIEFPAFYPAGALMLVLLVREHALMPDRRPIVLALVSLALVSLGIGWLLVSTVGGNNDLGWRGILPGVLVLIVAAAVGLSRWLRAAMPFKAAAVLGCVVLGLPGGIDLIRGYVFAAPPPSAQVFAATPALWEAVRRHSDATDRVANNPLFLADMTPWPVNISWALLANRRSCYAGRDLALPFAPVSRQRRAEIGAQFVRVFAGDAGPDDVSMLATRFGCRVAVVAAQDGAWTRDPFAVSPVYRLVEAEPTAWRIYKVSDPAGR
jgi:hypothetical protein